MDTVDRLIPYYRARKEELLRQYEGMYLVLSGNVDIQPFQTLGEAYQYGLSHFGGGNFMLTHCSRKSPVATSGFLGIAEM